MENREIVKYPGIKDFSKHSTAPFNSDPSQLNNKGVFCVLVTDFNRLINLSTIELNILGYIVECINKNGKGVIGNQFAVEIPINAFPDKGKNYVYSGVGRLLEKGILARSYAKDVYWFDTNFIH